MKKYVKDFCLRGLCCAVGGPVVLAIVYLVNDSAGIVTVLDPIAVCREILTVSFLAFVAAGITVVYQIERLPLMAAVAVHGAVLYMDYILIYLLNGWLKQQLIPVLVFTVIFVLGYGLIWVCIYTSIRKKTEQINQKLPGRENA